MPRDAKTYFSFNSNWEWCSDIFENHPDKTLKMDVTIFQLSQEQWPLSRYAILSLSDKVDKILEENECTLASPDDRTLYIIRELGESANKPVYGRWDNLAWLP